MLKVGQYVAIYGFEVKNDNDIYVVKNDYGNNSYCLYKVKLNGEDSNVKYRILFLNERHFNNPDIVIKHLNGIEELKQAKKEVNAFLKGVTDNETVISYTPADSNELTHKGVIKIINPIPTTKSIYKMPKGYYQIELLNNDRVVFRRLGKKGQVLSSLTDTYNMITFGLETVKQLMNEGYIIIVNKYETTKGKIKKQQKDQEKEQEAKTEIQTSEIEKEQERGIINQDPAQMQNENTGATVMLNNEMNGIEISFDKKPEQAVLEQLKANGFRWSNRQKIWYAKQSPKRLKFIECIGVLRDRSEVNKEPVTYPEINIDDIDTYTIDKTLQQREHDSNWIFRKDEKDRTKEIQNTFQEYNNKAIELLNSTEDPYIQYKIKKTLQAFKKKYFELYIKILQHKANNPSWAVTGPAGINTRRYNKMADRYHKMLGESITLTKKIEEDFKNVKWGIERKKQEAIKQEINEILKNFDNSNMPVFTTETKQITVAGYTETKRTYNYGGYTIAKSWGMFRIFDSGGKEVETTLNTTSKLTDAKAYVIYLVYKENLKETIAV
ncbi:hypothetical protein [Paenibacillus dendritiformis]|uniref:hypothetical protein n=1 Tax=Paenibacillus dendritiformis TaxID=130049 RepID=UPI00387E0288